MAVQAQTRLKSATPSPVKPLGNHGLRPPINRFALKSLFFSSSLQVVSSPQTISTAPRFSMRVASKQAYICRDCGYIYNDRTPFQKLPDNFFCPVCGAPKWRFKPYEPAITKNANDIDVRKARKVEIQRDEAIGKALPVAIVIGVADNSF